MSFYFWSSFKVFHRQSFFFFLLKTFSKGACVLIKFTFNLNFDGNSHFSRDIPHILRSGLLQQFTISRNYPRSYLPTTRWLRSKLRHLWNSQVGKGKKTSEEPNLYASCIINVKAATSRGRNVYRGLLEWNITKCHHSSGGFISINEKRSRGRGSTSTRHES